MKQNELRCALQVAKKACLKQVKGGIMFDAGTPDEIRMTYLEAAVCIERLFSQMYCLAKERCGLCKTCLYATKYPNGLTVSCTEKDDRIMHVYDYCSAYREDKQP